MPHFTQKNRFQTVVMWEPTGRQNIHGEPTALAPEELKVRLELTVKQAVNSKGETIEVAGTMVTDKVLKQGSIIWNGPLSDITGTGTEADPENLREVIETVETPTVNGRHIRYLALLQRYRKGIPETV